MDSPTSPGPGPVQDLKPEAWLAQRAAFVRPHLQKSLRGGLLQTLGILAQSWGLAHLAAGLFFQGLAFGVLWVPLLVFLAGLGLRSWGLVQRETWGLRGSLEFRRVLREDLIQKLLDRGPHWAGERSTGDLASRFVEQVDGFDGYISRYLPQKTLAMIQPLLILLAIGLHNWVSTLILLIMAPLIPLFMILIGKGARLEQEKQLGALSRLSGEFLDLVRGLVPLKIHRAQELQIPRLKHRIQAFRDKTLKVLQLAFMSAAALEFLSVLAIALLALQLGFDHLGFFVVGDLWGPLTLGSSLFILLLAPEFFLPLRELGAAYHAQAEALGALPGIREILDPPVEKNPQTNPPPRGAPALRLDQVSFGYQDRPPVFDRFSLEVKPGELLVIQAPSGGGKTTLLRLLLGHLRPSSGKIWVGDQGLETLDLAAWRESVGWMNQDVGLLAGSLEDNLRLAKRDADRPAMARALEWAGLGSWAAQNPWTWDLGEGGHRLSGGQKRRLGLARLALRDNDLMLLDEPTASLDPETQREILGKIQLWKGKKTILLMTHHQEAAQLGDRILQLPRGGRP